MGLEDVAMVFKVPGDVDLAVLPDLLENSCRGPVVPHAVVLIHLASDQSLVSAMDTPAVRGAMLRFDGRMPLIVASVDLRTFSLKFHFHRGISTQKVELFRGAMGEATDQWLNAGLSVIFDPAKVVFSAPAGYTFLKPSDKRSSYFIRAEQALATSGAVSFVAFAVMRRLVLMHQGVPAGLKLLFVDTMSVATTAFALREMLAHSGVSPLPQIDSFHSYGGMEGVVDPLPGSSLCIISASSSMSLHREWVRAKRVYDRDVLTLVTFEDAQDKDHALFALPATTRPDESVASSKYDIRIAGENFFPVNEPPRKVLLTTTHHGRNALTNVYSDLRGRTVFDVFRSTNPSSSRKGLFVDGDRLLECPQFQNWINSKLPHWLKIGTTQLIYQPDQSSRVLAQHIGYMLVALGSPVPRILSVHEVSSETISPKDALVAVGVVVGRGNALLSLSRELRNLHQGPRLYVIGAQVAESESYIGTFDKNLKHSSAGAVIDVLRMQACLINDAVAESFRLELSEIYSVASREAAIPEVLLSRYENLRSDMGRVPRQIFLPSGANLDQSLTLNEGFAFWPKGYSAESFQAEVLATMAAVLQNARTSDAVPLEQRLRSPMLMQIALDPENFSRFNEGIIQASILRVALPSELDFRGNADASAYMRVFLERMAKRLGDEQQPELEFLTALAIGRLRLADQDLAHVVGAFSTACRGLDTRLASAIRFLLEKIRHPRGKDASIAF